MKATLEPLDHKAWDNGETCIGLIDEHDNYTRITLRHPFGLPPSSRELDRYKDDDRQLEEIRAEILEGSPCYESEFALKVGKLIVTAINELPALLTENRRLREALEAKQTSQDISPFGRVVLDQTKKENPYGR